MTRIGDFPGAAASADTPYITARMLEARAAPGMTVETGEAPIE